MLPPGAGGFCRVNGCGCGCLIPAAKLLAFVPAKFKAAVVEVPSVGGATEEPNPVEEKRLPTPPILGPPVERLELPKPEDQSIKFMVFVFFLNNKKCAPFYSLSY